MVRVTTRLAWILIGTLAVLAGSCYDSSPAQGAAGGTLALTGARVIDGTGRAPLEQATVIVTDGRIQEVGPAATVKIPAGAARIDAAGKTIVPGLINADGHQRAARDSVVMAV